MKKQVLSSAILAVLSVSSAYAALPTIDPTTTSTLFIAGASAQRAYIEQLMVGESGLLDTDRICDQTKAIWKFSDTSGANNWTAYYCSKKTANLSLGSVKANILVHKRSSGGSDYGVAPVIANSAVGFLDLTTCTQTVAAVAGTTIGQATCTGTTSNHIPDLGVSDVEPNQFVGLNVTPGYTDVDPATVGANLTVTSSSAVVFGEPVTLSLYKALQAAQIATGQLPASCTIGATTEACMPNLSSQLIAAIHTGQVTSWNQIMVGTTGKGLYDWTVANQPALAPAANKVHIVRRVNGSGTQTQHGIVFLNYPCDIAAMTAINHGLETESNSGYVVHEETSAGNVKKALAGLETATALPDIAAYSGKRWGVGLNSLENSDANQEFVKIDGVAPTLANVNAGKYRDWVENTFQYNNAHYFALPVDVSVLLNTIVAKAASPLVLAALNTTMAHGFGNGAYLAIPGANTPTANGVWSAANPVNSFTRTPAGQSTDNCIAPNLSAPGVGFSL